MQTSLSRWFILSLVVIFAVVLAGCQAPLKIAICENAICEYGEAGTTGTCPADCPEGAPEFSSDPCDTYSSQSICVDVSGVSYSVACSILGDIVSNTTCQGGESCSASTGLCTSTAPTGQQESLQDTDNDGIPDSQDTDDDNDGILDVNEQTSSTTTPTVGDSDGDGIPDSQDPDDDNDGILDVNEQTGSGSNNNQFGHNLRDPDDFEYESTYPDAPGAGGSETTSGGSGGSGNIGDEGLESEIFPTPDCVHNWDCTEWSACRNDGLQVRECTYAGTCPTEPAYPALSQKCSYSGTCFDGMMNQNEEDIDCGGVCQACFVVAPAASCYDGFQNQGERGVDCGGPCATVCPSQETIRVVTKKPLSKQMLSLLGVGAFLLLILLALLFWKRKEVGAYLQKWHSKLKKSMPAMPSSAGVSSSAGVNSNQYGYSQQNYGQGQPRQNYRDLYPNQGQRQTYGQYPQQVRK